MTQACIDHGQKGNHQGYGHSGSLRLHRKVFLQEHGYLPPVVMHTCDNPRCINPAHLKAGDWETNNRDRAAKGRSAKHRPGARQLPEEAIRDIRQRMAVRKRGKDPMNGPVALAREYGVDTQVIYQVYRGRTYRDVA
jgi:hypothetical protein